MEVYWWELDSVTLFHSPRDFDKPDRSLLRGLERVRVKLGERVVDKLLTSFTIVCTVNRFYCSLYCKQVLVQSVLYLNSLIVNNIKVVITVKIASTGFLLSLF